MVAALNAAAYEVSITAVPIAIGGAPRHVAGGSSLGPVNVVIAPTPASVQPPPAPTTVSPDAEREANRQHVNNDRSAYTQQGLKPAGGEPWRPFVDGSNSSGFFWGGRGGRSW